MRRVGGLLHLARDMDANERRSAYRAVKQGQWLQLGRGIFVDAALWNVSSDEQRRRTIITAKACLHPELTVVGSSAAELRKLDSFKPVALHAPVEVGSEMAGTKPRLKDLHFHRLPHGHAQRSALEVLGPGPARVSSPEDMCAELALWNDFDDALVRIESAFNKRVLRRDDWEFTLLEIESLLHARKSAAQARKVLKLVTPFSESPMETQLKLALWRAGFEPPLQQVEVRNALGGVIGRADFMFDCGLIIEYDGRGKYGFEWSKSLGYATSPDVDTAHVIYEERRREKALHNAGFVVVRVDAESFRSGSFIHEIDATLTRIKRSNLEVPREQWTAAGLAWR